MLEYGCGTGSHSFELARRGADVVGIDISPTGVEIAKERAAQEGLTNASYLIMDAENMTFPAQSFDLVIGEGILHHLDMLKAYEQISRVLKSDGKAVFQEPLGHNPAINFFRWLTPKLRTKDEHPLLRRDLQNAGRFFETTNFHYFHLTSFASLLLLRTRYFYPSVNRLDLFDADAFRVFPPLRYLAWYVVMELYGPLCEESAVP